MKTITYNLAAAEKNSDNYYQDVRLFTEQVLHATEPEIMSFVNGFVQYINKTHCEPTRAEKEYIFDILTLGVLWNIYSGNALQTSKSVNRFLAFLYHFRRKHPKLKSSIDSVRGILSTLYLTQRKIHAEYLSLNNAKKLIAWLDATGEFREEVKRIQLILNYMETFPEKKQGFYFAVFTDFAFWFQKNSPYFLEKYTIHVADFRKTQLSSHKWKEDYIFCGRHQTEYHLSMVGAELMNQAFRAYFSKTQRKTVLVPACMRKNQPQTCKAKKVSLDYKCSGCTQDCRVNKLRLLGLEHKFDVSIIPHSSDFSAWLKNWAAGKDIGVVGVACPLNLITGGLELRALNIPAQCILLDYCGCKNHWHKTGFPTEINTEELLNLLEIKKPSIKPVLLAS